MAGADQVRQDMGICGYFNNVLHISLLIVPPSKSDTWVFMGILKSFFASPSLAHPILASGMQRWVKAGRTRDFLCL